MKAIISPPFVLMFCYKKNEDAKCWLWSSLIKSLDLSVFLCTVVGLDLP